ncbi:hypothetical protein [Desulfobacula sp.]|uniref:hypothetical protein n=1 Tax=Desulfobacula sp. TaxID=2593537 RepID=UPI00261DA3C4|nr:hypothetical protein [Desulfobacula sp.]
MNELTPAERWTIPQPWRGFFGVVVTVGYTFLLTTIFSMKTFNGHFTLLILSFIPILVMVALGWQQGTYPSTEGIKQPWRGILLTIFVAIIGVMASYVILNFMSRGAAQPFTNIYAITVVITTFFLVIAFGLWPFNKLSLGASGWLTLLLAYVLMFFLNKLLFNFDLLSFPTGEYLSSVQAVPFYAPGGPLAPFADIAPSGFFRWECAITFYFWMLIFLFSFAALDMWPLNKFPGIMKQPVLGIVLVITCGVLSGIAYGIGVNTLKIEPLNFMLYGICFLYGLLMMMTMFQMWPGRALSNPLSGFVNMLIAIVIGIAAYNAYIAIAVWHFGDSVMTYPNNIFVLATMMLGLSFPAWACYGDLWDFWPLPPTPAPPDAPNPE